MYGFWLPNDPRGSWCDFVGRWELVRFGRPRRDERRTPLTQLSRVEMARREAARKALMYPPVELTPEQTLSVASGFRDAIERGGYTIWACAIMSQHTHLVIARHSYKVEQIANLLKGEATKKIVKDHRHPLKEYVRESDLPSMWGGKCWKIYLDSEEAIENAIMYVENNPIEEGKPKQHWDFVKPYSGLDAGWVTYH
jgi:REP element-mobilizing transposase RayT